MAQKKTFEINRDLFFPENVNGQLTGVTWDNPQGTKYKCLHIRFDEFDREKRRVVSVYDTFVMPAGETDWSFKESKRTSVDDSEYRIESLNQNFGKLELSPFEDDLEKPIYGPGIVTEEDPEPDEIVVGYDKKLKADVVTEATFFDNFVFKAKYHAIGAIGLDSFIVSTICELYGLTIE